MSWSIGARGSKDVVRAELRKQLHTNDGYCGRAVAEGGMSYAEDTLRRAAIGLLLAAVEAQQLTTNPESYLEGYSVINAQAFGSESADYDHATILHGITVIVEVLPPSP